jgi:hypothetical protein
MSTLGKRVADLLGQVYCGIYHLDINALMRADWANDGYIQITVRDGHDMATYDDDTLTMLVLGCHLLNVRLRVRASTHGYLKLIFSWVTEPYFSREGHPTIEESLEKARDLFSGVVSVETEDQAA